MFAEMAVNSQSVDNYPNSRPNKARDDGLVMPTGGFTSNTLLKTMGNPGCRILWAVQFVFF
jgi:hypothetical protein